jgi:hypothetical protein
MIKINYNGEFEHTGISFKEDIVVYCEKCGCTLDRERENCPICGEKVLPFNIEEDSYKLMQVLKRNNKLNDYIFSSAKGLNTQFVLYELFLKLKELPYKVDVSFNEASNISLYIKVTLHNPKKNQSWESLDFSLHTKRDNLANHTEGYYLNKYTLLSNNWCGSMHGKESNSVVETREFLNNLVKNGYMQKLLNRLLYPFKHYSELL